MRINNNFLVLFFLLLLIFCTFTYSDAFQAEILPSEIKPGDAFAVKLSDITFSEIPAASINNKQMNFSSCGERCFIAIGAMSINTKPGNYNIQIKAGEEKKTLPLSVKQATFPELHITVSEEKVSPNAENLKRINREVEKLKAIWPKTTDRLWIGSFILPLENEFSTAFGTKRIFNKKRNSIHRGMDIRGKAGEEVKAINRSKVVLAEELFFGGNTVILDHGQGIYSIYMHLSAFKVKPDDIVSKGDTVGLVGATGRATGPHLHFGVKVLSINTNPVSFINLEL